MKKLLFILVSLSSTGLLAKGGAGHHEPHISNHWELTGHMDDPAIWPLFITFGIFVILLWQAIKKPLRGHVAARSLEVKNALEEAAKAKAAAEVKAREYEERLSSLDAEIDSLKADFQSRGEAELRRMEEAGKATAARVLKDAEDTIAAEVEKAHEELKAEAGRLSLELAEERITKALGADDHTRLTKSFLDDIAA